MSNINILSPLVADMIAAGEVVERPASVIKELVENALDAGAENIRIEIRRGGATYIRVTDDGCGMSPEDAGIAFLRHATSKLRTAHDLEAIGTMGFRGEALAAISAVSRIELITKEKGEDIGTRMILEAGDIKEMDNYGCPEGTTIIIKDLFFNTPARLKFMKSDRAESTACTQAALRAAMSRPDVSVRFIKDDKEEFFTPGDGDVKSAVYALLGRKEANEMLECNGDANGITVKGYVSSPSACRGNRSHQYFFCNGRFIKSTVIQAALEQAYENSMLVGHYPACVLYINLSYATVDVNVHPTKTEVKFADEKSVFNAVYYSALSAIKSENFIKPEKTEERQEETLYDSYFPVEGNIKKPENYKEYNPVAHYEKENQSRENLSYPTYQSPYKGSKAEPRYVSEKPAYNKPQDVKETVYEQKIIPQVKSENEYEAPKTMDFRFIGEVMDTYIIVEKDNKLVLIDKHACHERIIFDRLISTGREVMSQLLMMPVTVNVTQENAELIESNSELLQEIGFEIEPYGEQNYIVRAVPSDMYESDVAPAVEEICDMLREKRNIDIAGKKNEILKTVACKAAIKAGWKTDVKELLVLANSVISGKIKYCPHGRPVAMVYTREQLDKEFKRIV